jgi:hypothetical protein
MKLWRTRLNTQPSTGMVKCLLPKACVVDGIRYSPLIEEEEQALAFDEIAPSDDGMSYDEWEAVRIIKCIAALKLMRRCPPLFSPFALAACRSI